MRTALQLVRHAPFYGAAGFIGWARRPTEFRRMEDELRTDRVGHAQ
jgi:hypothetical protein